MKKVMIPASRADVLYSLDKGTIRKDYLHGRIGGNERPGRGRHATTLYVSVAEVDALYGAKPNPDPIA